VPIAISSIRPLSKAAELTALAMSNVFPVRAPEPPLRVNSAVVPPLILWRSDRGGRWGHSIIAGLTGPDNYRILPRHWRRLLRSHAAGARLVRELGDIAMPVSERSKRASLLMAATAISLGSKFLLPLLST
jgi:hypothetical protein